MVSVTLHPDIVQSLFDQALARADEEVCGLIGARHHKACSVYPVANMADNRSERFEMDAAAQISAMRQMREQDEQLYAIYHSHPRGEAEPSATDIAEACYPDVLYLIIGFQQTTPVLRGFYLQADKIDECALRY